jgi:hypothetical protein
VLDTFLSLKIKEVDYDGDLVKKDGKSRKEMMKKMSRRERKVRTESCSLINVQHFLIMCNRDP